MARIIGQVLPFLPLMRDADAQVARLVELHADDAALRASDPRSLATALVVLATGASPEPALAAAATDAVQRIHRLLGPAEQLGRVHRQLCEPPPPRSRWPRLLLALAPAAAAGAWTSSGYLAGRPGRATTMPGSQPDACPPAAGRLQPKWAP